MIFLNQKEKIAGLSVNEEKVGLLLLKTEKKDCTIEYEKERLLEEGVIRDGVVRQKELLFRALKEIIPRRFLRYSHEPRKVILNIPEELVRYETLLLPIALSSKNLKNSVVSHLEKHFPIPLGEVTYDWEEHPYSEKQKLILVALVERARVDPYIEAAQRTGLYPVACEGEFLSIRRFLGQKKKEGRLLFLVRSTRITSLIIEGDVPLFSRSISWKGKSEDLEKEILRVVEYYIAEHPKGPAIKEFMMLAGEKERALTESLAPRLTQLFKVSITRVEAPRAKNQYLPLLGSATRGQLPRGKDKFISLMVPGTEELFHEARILLFSRIVNDFLIIISIILVIIFSITSFYILPNFSQQKEAQIAIKRAQPATKEIAELEEKITAFNQLVEPLAAAEVNMPEWTLPLTDILIRVRPGIRIHSITMQADSSMIEVTGIADNIGSLIDFKSALSFSGIYEGNFTIPFSSFEKGFDIPFSYSLVFKDPSILFPLRAKEKSSPAALSPPPTTPAIK